MREPGEGEGPQPLGAPPNADPRSELAALRERGAQAFDPVRFCFIEALARRAAGHEGEARQLLEGKLAGALREYEERAAAAGFGAGGAGSEAPPALAQRTPLADLLGHLARMSVESLESVESPGQGGSVGRDGMRASAGSTASAAAMPPAELKALTHFRSTWARLSADLRLTQAVAKVPENAGPLNSHALALQSLQLMSELSPAYLQRFMSYVDSLLWLEQAGSTSAPAQKDVVHSEADKPRKAGRKRAG